MSLRDFVVIAAVGGGAIGLAGLLTKNRAWRSFFSTMASWPGTTIACLGALVGVCIVFGKPIVDLFKGLPRQQVFLLEVAPKPEL